MTSLKDSKANIENMASKLKRTEGRDSIYMNSILTRKIIISIHYINKNIKSTLEKIISSEIEGKCIVDGYIKRDSTKILTYSSGLISGENLIFDVVLECKVCNPVEGMTISCIAKNITKAGIRAETEEEISPIVIFIARDHHYLSKKFSEIKENETIKVKVIGQRFELNDKYISIIGELVVGEPVKKKKLILKEK